MVCRAEGKLFVKWYRGGEGDRDERVQRVIGKKVSKS